MTGPSAVSPTELAPEWDVTLTDGTDSVGFTLGAQGAGGFVKDPRRIQRTPIQRTALKTSQGGNKYDDLEWPYMTIPQDDWSGGRGMLTFDDDASRYYDGYRCDTSMDGKVILGPLETYSTVPYMYTDGYPILENDLFVWSEYTSAPAYYARSFVASDDYDSDGVQLWIKKIGTPGDLIAAIYSDSGGEPDTLIDSSTLAASSVNGGDPYLYRFKWSPTGSTISLTGGTTYHIVVYVSTGTHDATNYWAVGFEKGVSGKYSVNGTSWDTITAVPFFRFNTVATITGYDKSDGIFFEYKGSLYWVSIPPTGEDSILYINGDRGAADSNSTDKTNLVDATKSTTWVIDEWAGCIVKITAGPGSDEPQNWRTIVGNTTTALVCSPDWNIAHTTSTEYIILKSNKWAAQQSISSPVTDVAVSGEIVFLACGFDANTKVYREYRNTSGDWTKTLSTGSIPRSEKLLAILESDGTYKLHGTSREYNEDFDYPQAKRIWNATVFPTSMRTYKDYGEVFPTNVPWSNRVITNVTHDVNDGMSYIQVASGFGTGTLAVYEPPEPVDLTNGEHLGFWIKANETFTAGQLQLKLDDTPNLGQTPAPTKFLAPRRMSPTRVFLYDWSGNAYNTDATFGRLYDGTTNGYTVAGWTTDDWLFVGFSSPFSALYFNMDSVSNNSETATMTVRYFDGKEFSTLGTNDKTLSGGATLAQDGLLGFTSIPERWEPSYVNSVEAYWVALVPSANLTANIIISDINVIAAATADVTAQAIDPITSTTALIWPRQYDGIYVGWSDKFNAVYFNMGTTVNTEESSMTAYYYNGYSWTSLTISDGTETANDTLAQDGNITFTIPYNWQTYTIGEDDLYWIKFIPVPDTSTDELDEVDIGSIYVTRQNNVTIDLPAIGDFDWTYVVLTPTVGFNKYPYPDCTQIKSIALASTADPGAYVIRLHGGIHLLDDGEDIVGLEDEVRVNNIAPYGSSSGIGINPYILTESGIYEIQQENDNAIVKLPIGEISAFASHDNGVAYCTNDVYLYFNLGRKIERYYNGNLEDIGPDLDDGLPAVRQGDVSCLISYPGRIYASINAGTGSTQYSSVLLYKGNGWHEIYRAPSGMPIYTMYYQSIPNSSTGRLWIAQDRDILWIPVSTSPDTDPDYYYTPSGYYITGWFYAGMWAIKKVFDSLTMFIENAYPEQIYAEAEYQLDDSTTSWITVSGDFDTAVEEISLATVRPSGRRIRFRIHLQTYNTGNTPVLSAMSVDLYGVVPVKYQYTWTGLLSEYNAYDVNLDGNEQIALGYNNAAETALAKLDAWTDAATVLTMNSRFSVYDSKTVLLTAPAHVPVDINSELQIERHVLSITCHDL